MKEQCLIIAGEKSGEEHFLSMWPELKNIQFWGVGGTEMKEHGVELLYHLKDFSSMGLSEVIVKIRFYQKAMTHILDEVEKRKCKTALLIDFQGFNLRLAEKLTKKGVKVLYYVAPQAWIWKKDRVYKLRDFVSSLYTILPFEKNWFEERGVKQVIQAPHPVFTESKSELVPRKFLSQLPKKWNILLLPGSRKKEVKDLLRRFISACEQLKKSGINLHVTVVKSKSVGNELFVPFGEFIDETVDNSQLNEVIKRSHFAFAASGTVTLSTGLFQLPTIVTYSASLLSDIFYKSIVRYNGPVSLTNILIGQKVFPEILLGRLNSNQLYLTIKRYLTDINEYNQVVAELKSLRDILDVSNFNVGLDIKNKIENCYETSD